MVGMTAPRHVPRDRPHSHLVGFIMIDYSQVNYIHCIYIYIYIYHISVGMYMQLTTYNRFWMEQLYLFLFSAKQNSHVYSNWLPNVISNTTFCKKKNITDDHSFFINILSLTYPQGRVKENRLMPENSETTWYCWKRNREVNQMCSPIQTTF